MKASIIIVTLFFTLNNVLADEIYLKSNNILKGKVIKVTEFIVEYDPQGDKPFAVVPKDKIRKIVYDNGKVVNFSIENSKLSYNSEKISDWQEYDNFLLTSGLLKNKILIWGGIHNHLYGYTDQRYKEYDDNGKKNDQGDYIKTDAKHFGFEFYLSDFSHISPKLKVGKAGINFSGYIHDRIPERNLYAIPSHNISEEIKPGKTESEQHGKWRYNLGFFIGTDMKWWNFDIGLTYAVTFIKEKDREKLDPDSDPNNPTYIETEGRGIMADKSKIVPNFFIRLGLENSPHFTFSIFREDYDPEYGALMAKIIFPIGSYLRFNMGGYLWQTQAAFIEPVISYKGVSLGFRTGLIINYHDDDLQKVGIQDSLFYSCSLSYEWK